MAAQKLIFLISSLLLLSFAFASVNAIEKASSYEEPEEKVVDVVVEGVVYCQSCDVYGTWSLTGAKPIPSAKVSVICKDHKSRVSFYKVFATDKNGYFYGQLEGFKMDHYLLDHPLHACGVHLVSSPLSNCNHLTNLNYGINGSPLRYENKRLFGSNYEAVVYSSGPLAFRPAFCPKTDEHY
ncbi:Pollen Ole e 1 allergen/extensin [Macleaya cordata]|uniref:Pollen Ole e 1 allergen/extensin n=1 Tax=Macleaya cordata TaxID=56857 RepID=A0A200PLR3_MACCD|nr:Pollen Ole e 1 allergen/extensin [Macleaya cordata]